MEISVKMTAEEFLEFTEYQRNRAMYAAKVKKISDKLEYLTKKVCWAIEADAKRPGKVKIADQEHAAELLEQATDFLA